MLWFSRFDRHSGLVDRMEETLGIDPGAALAEGRLSPGDLRGVVMACMGCRETAACEDWLAEHQAGAESPPAYCKNRELFARILDLP